MEKLSGRVSACKGCRACQTYSIAPAVGFVHSNFRIVASLALLNLALATWKPRDRNVDRIREIVDREEVAVEKKGESFETYPSHHLVFTSFDASQ